MSWTDWKEVEGEGLDFEEIIFEKKTHDELGGGIARVTIDKGDAMNVMTLNTVDEMFRAFYDANHDTSIGVIIVAGKGKLGAEQDDNDIFGKSRPRGLFRADKVNLMDGTQVGPLRAVHGTITKKAKFSEAGGDWLEARDFEAVLEYAAKKIRGLGHEILNGKIGVQPYQLGNQIPCTYCPYRRVCRVEPLTRPYRGLEKLDKTQAIEKMR